ncbi:serine/threonine-protein kinase haspin homolog isoform X1 [Zingiber officinale]|uniref:serine/threonine-protein kinase haspin homolog isoform X1 n=1 Tax=Zingiber officinale TaxID=94328 RepID=UPI001C4C7B83|nr:serine/threonine-protein kinase haspin homolog isoform X1 [Zingiber officinale]
MASPTTGDGSDLWAEIVSQGEQPPAVPQVAVVYERRRRTASDTNPKQVQICRPSREWRVSFAPTKRPSWNRSLSTRGRESIVVATGVYFRPQVKQRGAPKRGKKGGRAKKTGQDSPDFTKEKNYFLEVDSFELLEESPSPKNFSTWTMGAKQVAAVHDLPAILERWKISKLVSQCGSSQHLFKIMETPFSVPSVLGSCGSSNNLTDKTPERDLRTKLPSKFDSYKESRKPELVSNSSIRNLVDNSIVASFDSLSIKEKEVENGICENAEILQEVHVSSESKKATQIDASQFKTSDGEYLKAFDQLLIICRQSAPISLGEVFSRHCELSSIVKIGEGTYGEAFKAGQTVCKVVPIDGDLLVNGEVQKKSEEVLEEVMLSLTLNSLRGRQKETNTKNACSGFIETKDFCICRGPYDDGLISAWEDWDAVHGSENDHPKEFVENQCYIVFVLADGGKDLESFVLGNYDEARSLLVQATIALAVAESACEFEHRDLHWGNILLTDTKDTSTNFTLHGKKMRAKTFGLAISIIDFTLSRINTGEAILFLDLSADPGLFEGPKGDKQFETYRKMKDLTEDCWEGSFPKTNVLWLIYLVDILLTKKSFKRTAKDERDLRSFKKRLNEYGSATDSLSDSFFSGLLINDSE